MFTVAKVNGPAIIVNRKRHRKVFAKNISMIEKYKHISDPDGHLVEMNAEHTLSGDRGVIRIVSRTYTLHAMQRKSLIPYTKSTSWIRRNIHSMKTIMKLEKLCGISDGVW